jgi:hypothetical protein
MSHPHCDRRQFPSQGSCPERPVSPLRWLHCNEIRKELMDGCW